MILFLFCFQNKQGKYIYQLGISGLASRNFTVSKSYLYMELFSKIPWKFSKEQNPLREASKSNSRAHYQIKQVSTTGASVARHVNPVMQPNRASEFHNHSNISEVCSKSASNPERYLYSSTVPRRLDLMF